MKETDLLSKEKMSSVIRSCPSISSTITLPVSSDNSTCMIFTRPEICPTKSAFSIHHSGKEIESISATSREKLLQQRSNVIWLINFLVDKFHPWLVNSIQKKESRKPSRNYLIKQIYKVHRIN